MAAMTDVIFPVSGNSLPPDYAMALWREIVRIVPGLEDKPSVGILPLRAPDHGSDLLLPKRAKLVLRIPSHMAGQVQQLSGQMLNVGGHALSLGEARERPLQPSPTLHAQLVASCATEDDFMAAMAVEMQQSGITGKLICGKQHTLPGSAGKISGFSLVVHELNAQDALSLQCIGLGGERHFGCGLFIPYKVIANLDGQNG
jgi:CRISPR-associated protein Cas6